MGNKGMKGCVGGKKPEGGHVHQGGSQTTPPPQNNSNHSSHTKKKKPTRQPVARAR